MPEPDSRHVTATPSWAHLEAAQRKRPLWPWLLLAAGALVMVLLLGRCTVAMTRAWKQADAAVADFHQKLDAEDYHSIYVSSDPAFRQSGSEQQMDEFFGAVHQKLGAVQETKKANLFVNTNTGGTFARVTYQTRFASGTATETFTWRMGLNDMKLVGYNIDSRELVTK